MAIIKCSECGREISTLASQCPGCGAPQSATKGKPSKIIKYGGGFLAVCFLFIIFSQAIILINRPANDKHFVNNESTDNTINEKPDVSAKEESAVMQSNTIYYSIFENDKYGYEQGISENDQNNGILSKPLLMYEYLGEHDGVNEVRLKQAGAVAVMSCAIPCSYIRTRVFSYGQIFSDLTAPNNEGTVGWEVFEDAANGHLIPHAITKGEKKFQEWYGDDDAYHLYPMQGDQ